MKSQFISYKQAIEIKELGFDEDCFLYWYKANNGYILVKEKKQTFQQYILAPTFSQAFRFFRDKKLSDYCICRYQGRNDGGIYYYYVINHDFGIEETKHYKEGFFSYEEAESACLDKLIEIIKTKQQ